MRVWLRQGKNGRRGVGSGGMGEGEKRGEAAEVLFFKHMTAYYVLSGIVGSKMCIIDRPTLKLKSRRISLFHIGRKNPS